MRGPQRRTHSRVTTFKGMCLRRRQCAANSGARTAKRRQSFRYLDATRQHAAHSGARVAQGDDTLRHSAATKQCAARSGVRTAEKRHSDSSHCSDARCRETAFFGIPLRRNAVRKSWAFHCDEGGAQPTAARQRNPCTPMRSPQRRTHCRATKFIDPWLSHDAIVSLYQLYWLSTF